MDYDTVVREFKDELAIDFTVGGIKLGAKWQQKQNKNLYSEEEVWNILHSYNVFLLSQEKTTVDKWFEQFKKK